MQILYSLNRFILISCLWISNSLISGCSTTISLPEQLTLPPPREEIALTQPDPLAVFESTNADDSRDYLLGTGDEISVDVWGYPELSGTHTVGPDGNITLPIVGDFSVAYASRQQAASHITTALKKYYVDLKTTVKVNHYFSNRILVLGRVKKPGEIRFEMTTPTILEAISLAGGFVEPTGLENGQSLPFTRCAIFRGRTQVAWIELEPLLKGKDLSLNLKLQRNDILYVPDVEERLIYVLGEVKNPGALRLTPNMSFIEALAKAGGPTIDAAPNRINIIRPADGINQELALDALITPNQRLNIALKENDIIYVPTNTIAKINYAIKFLTPFSTILGIYADIESIRADKQRRVLDQQQERIDSERAALENEKAANEGFE